MIRLVVRFTALAWLLAVAPLELATAMTGLLRASAPPPGALALALIGSRVLVVATGLVLGQRLLQRQRGLQWLARGWAAADLATLAFVLASAPLPSNRVPGDAPLIWMAYAAAAAVVIAAASAAPAMPRREPH
jgi:hypothetical protein